MPDWLATVKVRVSGLTPDGKVRSEDEARKLIQDTLSASLYGIELGCDFDRAHGWDGKDAVSSIEAIESKKEAARRCIQEARA